MSPELDHRAITCIQSLEFSGPHETPQEADVLGHKDVVCWLGHERQV